MEETKMDKVKGHFKRNKKKYLIGSLVGVTSAVVPTVVVKMVKEAYEQGKMDTLKALSATLVESYADGYNAAYEELTSTSATDESLHLIKESLRAMVEEDPESILAT